MTVGQSVFLEVCLHLRPSIASLCAYCAEARHELEVAVAIAAVRTKNIAHARVDAAIGPQRVMGVSRARVEAELHEAEERPPLNMRLSRMHRGGRLGD